MRLKVWNDGGTNKGFPTHKQTITHEDECDDGSRRQSLVPNARLSSNEAFHTTRLASAGDPHLLSPDSVRGDVDGE